MRRHRQPGDVVSVPDRSAVPSRLAGTRPHDRLLGNGRFLTLLTGAGTGGAWLEGQALTAWGGDRVEDRDGWFVYLRDLADRSFWSLGERPVPSTPDAYTSEGGPGGMAFERRQAGIVSRMDVWVDPGLAAECRRITLRNASGRARRIELTSYMEVVLQDPRSHAAHPGFSKLFVQTEWLAEPGLLLARRRPRSPDDRHPWIAHAAHGPGAPAYATDRGSFIGRGRGLDAPLAMVSEAALSQVSGDVLDPILALRRVIELPPGAEARVDLVLAAGWARDEAIAIARSLETGDALGHSRRAAAEAARETLERLGLAPAEAERLDRLAIAMLRGELRRRADAPPARALCLNGEPPVPLDGTVALVDAGVAPANVRRARAAGEYWNAVGLPVTTVVLEDGILGRLDAAAIASLRARADLVVSSDAPFPPDARDRAGAAIASPREPAPARSPASAPHQGSLGDEPLRCGNGWGGFNARGDEYVIRMPRGADGRPRATPQPWINVLANPGFGSLVSASGAAHTWSRNSREFRLTPWSNDPVCDPHDEALYLRDDASGHLWSPFPGPIPGDGPYEMRHGFGYSLCRHVSAGLEIETEVFVHADDPVKIVEVRITNPGTRARRLTVTSYQRLVLGHSNRDAVRDVSTWADGSRSILFARSDAPGDFADAVAFAAPVAPAGARVRMGADREQVLGPGGSPARPAALRSDAGPDGRTGAGLDPCFCIEVRLDIGPGETRACAFLLGEAGGGGGDAGAERIETLVLGLRRPGALAAARERVGSRWAEWLGRVRIETPVETLDLLANGWLAYQVLACRLWARTAFYQSGGAFGFRDQLQDAAALLMLDPQIARGQILLHAGRQFVQGDVLHWWHPPGGRGIRTRFADDLLWLPFVTATYVQVTGDAGVLDEQVPFLEGRALEPGEDEAFLAPGTSAETADVYEHCCRAIERSLGTGLHGLPLFGTGDWNDGMNRVGREGRGESVWMAFFLCAVIDAFAPVCEGRGDAARAGRLRAHRQQLEEAIERAGWDGAWYRRGFHDDGTALGSRDSDECRIDALVQAWSVLSSAAPPGRSAQAMDAVERELIAWPEGIVRLLAPPFDRTPLDPGYIKGYVPGVRENGGQYTHAAMWVAAAMARLGRSGQAARLLERLSPAWHGSGPRAGAYQVEPYVVAADVYANPQHVGRGGWTWYTGSAGWMLRVLLEELLGVSIEDGRTLVLRAGCPDGWPGYRVRLRPFGRTGTWDVEVRRAGVSGAEPRGATGAQPRGATVDGRPVALVGGVARVPLVDDGLDHRVEIQC